jgi:hypothetical protein
MNLRNLFNRILWVTYRAWLVTGLCTIAVAFGFGVYTSVFLIRSVATKGTIVDLVPERDEENDTVNYASTFTFIAVDGKTYTVTSGVATNPPGFKVGQDVQVYYLKSHPANAKLASFWQLWFVTILCAGLGLFFSGAGYLLLRFERRRKTLRKQIVR